jgi:capsular exopolysaccharide synthesis family protein
LIVGVGLAFLVERLDDGINSREAAERAADGLPVVGLIPMVDSWKRRGSHHVALLEDPNSMVSEAYRSLRTSVQFLSIDHPTRVIGITSSVPDEGKTTAVANLAVSFARAGQRVIVVSCDLRRPRIHQFFQLENRVGLTSLLLDTTSVSKALQPIPAEPNLRLLSSGPVPPNPAEILSHDGVRQLVEQLAAKSDIVLLDCPPVLPVTDAVLLSRLVDAMLVVAAAKSTSTRELHRTFEMLRQVGAPALGTILNRVPTEGGYAYSYGYGYGYGYGYYATYRDEPEPAPMSSNGSAESDQKTGVPGSTSARKRPEDGSPVAKDTGSTSVAVGRDDAELIEHNGDTKERESKNWEAPGPSPPSELR